MALKTYALTTVARLCAFMDISVPTGGALTAMTEMINAVTELIEGYIGRRLKETAYSQEEYDTEYAQTLNLQNFPVSTTAAFTLESRKSSENENEWDTVESKYYHVDNISGIIEGAGGSRFVRTTKGYRVSYTAGYSFDNSSTYLADTVAGDIELAAWMLMSGVWNKRRGGSAGEIASERIGDYAVSYRATLLQSKDVRAILDKYAEVGGSGGGEGVGVIGPLTPAQ